MSATEIFLKELLYQGCFDKCRGHSNIAQCQQGCKLAVGRSLEAGALAYSVLADAGNISVEDMEARHSEGNSGLNNISRGVAKQAESSCARQCNSLGIKDEIDSCSKGCELLWKSIRDLSKA